jgi:hypothetical protein
MFNLIRFNFLPMLRVSMNRERHPPCLWCKKPKQCTHWDLEEMNVWDTTPKNAMYTKYFEMFVFVNLEGSLW